MRLDADAYSLLTMLAIREGVAPTTMARMFLRRSLAAARAEDAGDPLS